VRAFASGCIPILFCIESKDSQPKLPPPVDASPIAIAFRGDIPLPPAIASLAIAVSFCGLGPRLLERRPTPTGRARMRELASRQIGPHEITRDRLRHTDPTSERRIMRGALH
jgi:hypothetical protein